MPKQLYFVGASKHSITYAPNGLPLQGFMDNKQLSNGQVYHDLYARTFLIQEESAPENTIVYTVADIWSCTNVLKQAVLDKIKADQDLNSFLNEKNVLICGTHSHNGGGGYGGYNLYNYSFNTDKEKALGKENLNVIAEGIFQSIRVAFQNKTKGSISYYNNPTKATLKEIGGFNRSLGAYENNKDKGNYSSNIDTQMYAVRFSDVNDHLVGLLTWFPIHPNCFRNETLSVSGDSKGLAAYQVEEYYASIKHMQVVSAFSNSNCGDVSPHNPKLNMSDEEKADYFSKLQSNLALQLLNDSTSWTSVSGNIESFFKKVDFTNITIDAHKKTTFPAIGFPTMIGSKEDALNSPFAGNREDWPKSKMQWIDFVRIGLIKTLGKWFAPKNKPSFSVLLNDDKKEVAQKYLIQNMPKYIGEWPNVLEYLNALADELNPKSMPEFIQYLESVFKPNSDLMKELAELKSNGPDDQKFIVLQSVDKDEQMFPFVLPLQLHKIGNLLIVAIPSEITTMAGRRLRAALAQKVDSNTEILITTYANDYAQYITTKDEYDMQHYEGSSTIYGPYTLEAYIKEFEGMLVADNQPLLV